LYYLRDLSGDDIPFSYYKQQLVKTDIPSAGRTFFVNKVLKSRTDKIHGKQYFCSFQGYPPKFNSWVAAADMVSEKDVQS
jgi:hypothetical protein